MDAGNPDLAQMAQMYRQLGPNQPNAGDQIAQGIQPGMPSYGGNLNDLAAQQIMSSSQQAQGEQAGLYQEHQALEGQRRALLAQQAQQAQAAVPHFGAMMRPVTGQGIGHDILNGIRDVGVGALAVGSATGPGQAIEGALYAPQRQALAATASQLRSGEEAAKTTGQEFGSVSSEQARPFGAMAETGRTQQLGQQFEKTNARLIAQLGQQFKIAMSRISTEKDIAARRNETNLQIARMLDDVKLAGIKAGLSENEATNVARIQGAKIAGESGFVKAHEVLTAIDNWVTGAAPEAFSGNLIPGTQNPPAQPTTPQGSKGRSAPGHMPARPKGVPAGARWNPTTRTWQLHQ